MILLKAGASALLLTVGAAAMLPIGGVTFFRARRLYSWMARRLSLGILALHGIRIHVHAPQPFPRSQTIYVSNHTSTLDLFVLVALGLPNCRFFLSGFLRKVVPLGVIAWMMGTFFTVPQDRPAERTRIFKRAAATLRRTRESVYLSPEGGRVVSGEIGHFNKGSFHLATDLRLPIVPMYFHIPKAMDPGRGYRARAGTVHVHVLPPIDTSTWTEEDLPANTARVRDLFVRIHEEMRCASRISASAA
ncbi:MAG TPA: lysophospholipid acyltransferase family protein [Vicinamibacterales bacterium]|nr:lysophospholipid acyltransferase family protein [Vicinamibacterales bacterium]